MPFRHLAPLVCAALAMYVLPARADCVDDCQASTYCDDAMHLSGECSELLNQCYQLECNRPSESFGAIAYGASSRAYGYSYDSPNADAAATIALNNCRKHGGDCEVVLSFSNSCGAVAAVGSGSSYAVGQGATRGQAEYVAVDNCRKDGGGDDCQVQVWSCAVP